MGLAMKIKKKIIPDTLKSGQSQVGETNMHSKNNPRGATPNASYDESTDFNGVEKTEPLLRRMPRDSGIEIGHDSRFIEHVEVDPSHPKQSPTAILLVHT